jgi:hypothetical protein
MLLVAGCNVEVGEGHIEPVTFDGVVALPSGKERTNLTDASFRTDDGDQVVLRAGPPIQVSVTREIEFFSAAQSTLFRKQLDGHTIVHIDLDVKTITLSDASSDAPITDAVGSQVLVGDVVLGKPGTVGRVWAGNDTTNKVIDAIHTEQPLLLDVEIQVQCTPDQLAGLPTFVHASVVVQPILTVKVF